MFVYLVLILSIWLLDSLFGMWTKRCLAIRIPLRDIYFSFSSVKTSTAVNILVSFCLCTCVISICLVVKSMGYSGCWSLILFHIPNSLMRLNQFTLCQDYMIFINTFNFAQWHACDTVSHCVFKWHFSE